VYRNFYVHNLTTLSSRINDPWYREDFGASVFRGMCGFDISTDQDGAGYWSSGNLKLRVHRGNNQKVDPKSYYISGESNYTRAGFGPCSGIINASTEYRPIEFYIYATPPANQTAVTFNYYFFRTYYK
jgi:hypothetical protein